MNGQEKTDIDHHIVFLLIGSNITPKTNLVAAIKELRRHVDILNVSSVWESPADGGVGPDFLNAVVEIATELPPAELKKRVLRPVETFLGRVRTRDKYAPRTIDLDILVYDNAVLDPIIWQRGYAAAPFAELLPDFTNRQTGENIQEVAERFRSKSQVWKRNDIQLLSLSHL